jgi:glycosyltransferase involved in cell wall biosynthesis
MKILVIQDCLRSGGTERQSILLTRGFAAAGHETTLLTFRPGGVLAPAASGLNIQSLQPFDLRLDWFAPGLFRHACRTGPEVVLCMGRMANCYAGGLQERLPDAAVIATMRTGKPLPRLFRRSLGRVRHVVANSRDARDALIARHHVPAGRISVIRNSLVFPAAAAPQSAAKLRSNFGATDATRVMVCVAMFRPEKNQRELIETVAGLPSGIDWQLWLAGDGPARADCEKLVAAKHLAARVKFPGFLRDPSALYAAADLAVHASSSESLSNFLIEAQAHGLPAVAFRAQGIGESFVPGETGWEIARGDREAFRAALVRLMSEPPEVQQHRSTAARAFARANFDPQRQVAAYLELFDTLRRPPAP